MTDFIQSVRSEMDRAHSRYGDFFSTHEALGVLTEEYHELVEAVRKNALSSVQLEALQLAAVALRLAEACESSEPFKRRSQP